MLLSQYDLLWNKLKDDGKIPSNIFIIFCKSKENINMPQEIPRKVLTKSLNVLFEESSNRVYGKNSPNFENRTIQIC